MKKARQIHFLREEVTALRKALRDLDERYRYVVAENEALRAGGCPDRPSCARVAHELQRYVTADHLAEHNAAITPDDEVTVGETPSDVRFFGGVV